jgi:hypothetical protein
MTFSKTYVATLTKGPFPGRIDPWAEIGVYFQQIHSGMISNFLEMLGQTLLTMGYIAGRERSLQIIEPRQPDVTVRAGEQQVEPSSFTEWNYVQAAAAVSAEPGIAVSGEYYDLENLQIEHMETGELVTIVEIISPSNKVYRQEMQEYIDQRDYFVHSRNVNFVEIDLTRSVKRLLQDKVMAAFAYHIAIYLPHQLPRVIGMKFGEVIKPFALPLRQEVLLVEAQSAYENAYRTSVIGAQIRHDGRYTEADLPFPTLLTSEQRSDALAAVEQWMNELERLK